MSSAAAPPPWPVLTVSGAARQIAHGSARARAITRACLLARDLVRAGITGQVGQVVAGSPASARSRAARW